MRVMVINNGVGTEFKNYNSYAAVFGDEADAYMAARGHNGNQSPELLKHYTQDLGFEYMSASNKSEFQENLARFTTPELTDKPMFFEVFTNSVDESNALHIVANAEMDAKSAAKGAVKNLIGEKGVTVLRKLMGK